MGLVAAELNFFLVPKLYLGTQLWPKLGLGTRNKDSLLEKLRLPYVS
jgi:hypothetical protein